MKTGIELISEERHRQITVEGWTPDHDDSYVGGELALAAAVYASPVTIYRDANGDEHQDPCGLVPDRDNAYYAFRYVWPWGAEWLKRRDRIRDLEKAGALIAAEIDRLQRKPLAENERKGEDE